MVAATSNQPGSIRYLLEEGKANIEAELSKDGYVDDIYMYEGSTSLHLAVDKGNLEAIKMLLKKGANPNAERKHPFHTTAIQSALSYGYNWDQTPPKSNNPPEGGHLEIVQELIKYDVDLNVKDSLGQNLLHHAANGRNTRYCSANFKYLISSGCLFGNMAEMAFFLLQDLRGISQSKTRVATWEGQCGRVLV